MTASKQPRSVLVIIHTPALEVRLIRRPTTLSFGKE
jgi:hypothetical protein